MTGRVLLVAALLACVGASAALASSASDRWDINLTPRQEVPAPKLSGHKPAGEFVIFYDASRRVLTWTMRFGGMTGPVTAAHIHAGTPGKSGPVLVPICGPCTSPSAGTVHLSRAQAKLFRNALPATYVNLHTRKNPNGEIRGQFPPPVVGHGCAPC